MDSDPSDLDAIVANAAVRHRAGELAAADEAYDSVLSRDPGHAEALHLKGVLRAQQGAADEGLQLLDRALAGAPKDFRILANRAKLKLDLGDVDAAVEDYSTALQYGGDNADLLFNTAGALAMAGRLEDAVARLEEACRIAPGHAQAHANLGNLYRQLGRLEEAGTALEKAIELAPGDPAVQHSLGVTLMLTRDYEAAAARFKRALELDRGFIRTAAQLFYANLHACDWRNYGKLAANFVRLIENGGAQVSELSPLIALFLPASQRELNATSDARAATIRGSSDSVTPAISTDTGERLRIGYLSADLGRHPVGHLTADVFSSHDREEFETSAILLAPPDGSAVSEHVARNTDHVLDISRMSAANAARSIRELGVDVLVDLGGFTRGARPEILAHRAAPLQVGWLGYCGSSGGLNDVLLADENVLPASDAGHFSEAVAYLPGSFMPLNHLDRADEDAGTRSSNGLPDDAFVFCAFNTPTKIDPATFDAWMQILDGVDNGVLWLREHAAVTTRNLQLAAQGRGIDPARLIFAKTLPDMSGHLARHAHADLFLDTFVYGAHSTAADAVATGLPILTCAGGAMPARVGASLARAFDQAELVAESRQAYVDAAVSLAADPERLSGVRERLADALVANRDGPGFARKLESAYRKLWDVKCADELAAGTCIRVDETTR